MSVGNQKLKISTLKKNVWRSTTNVSIWITEDCLLKCNFEELLPIGERLGSIKPVFHSQGNGTGDNDWSITFVTPK